MNFNKIVKLLLKTSIPCLIVFLFLECKNSKYESDYFDPNVVAVHYNKKEYVGAQTCLECHKDVYESHLETAHFNTSAIADEHHIKGNFEQGENILDLRGVRITLNNENGDYFQKSIDKINPSKEEISRLDIVIGSGVKGQSFLSWEDDALYQLQASYYSPSNQWINSPNFPETSYKRPVNDACLKCHVTFAKNIDPEGKINRYDRDAIIYGIDCERCHGPSKEHVVFHRNNPDVKNAEYMDDINDYSRQQRLDVCAVCHSGLQSVQIKGNPFSFVSGDTLDLFSKNFSSYKKNTKLDVHGNQYGLLVQSKCFIESKRMDCTTCHDPHKNQRSDFSYFNQKCISCHETNSKPFAHKTDHPANKNCISCHMPNIPSDVMKISLDPDEKEAPVYIRTHLIGIH